MQLKPGFCSDERVSCRDNVVWVHWNEGSILRFMVWSWHLYYDARIIPFMSYLVSDDAIMLAVTRCTTWLKSVWRISYELINKNPWRYFEVWGKSFMVQDAARKALEAALGEKKEAFSKWDEEIKKRETDGGGGGGRGRGWGKSGGGGGGGESTGSSNNNSWEEPKQMILAFSGLAALVSIQWDLLTASVCLLGYLVPKVLGCVCRWSMESVGFI